MGARRESVLDVDLDGNLPLALSSLVGRRREIEELADLLVAARMVTIAGRGGAGKTRLALEVAEQTSSRFPDGVWWVDLAPLTGAGLLPTVVAGVLGVPQAPGESSEAVLARHLRGRSPCWCWTTANP